MAHPIRPKPDFSRVIARYPEQTALIRRLLLREPSFRQVCEDFLFLLDTLAGFESRTKPLSAAEQEDYSRLRTELELEITRRLLSSDESRRS